MINDENIRSVVPKGLSSYTGVSVIRSNQDVPPPYQPQKPYIVYTVITLESENNGTYGIYDDGISRKPVTQTWSFTVIADTDEESIRIASKAKEWLEYSGTYFLNSNEIICQKCSAITNRDNILSEGFEYRNGFDAWFWGFSEIETPVYAGEIDTVEVGQISIDQGMTDEELNELLEMRLAGDINNGR